MKDPILLDAYVEYTTTALTALFIAVATIAGVVVSRQEEEAGALPRGRMEWARAIAYWLCTILVAFEMAAGSVWGLLSIEYVRVAMTRLGYPLYLPYILAVWKVPCPLVLLAPRFPRLKEWAYAGSFFNYTGAAASHIFVGHGAGKWAGPLVFAVFTLVSWVLRPETRRLSQRAPSTPLRAMTWCVPVLIAAVMVAFSFLTLPQGPPPE